MWKGTSRYQPAPGTLSPPTDRACVSSATVDLHRAGALARAFHMDDHEPLYPSDGEDEPQPPSDLEDEPATASPRPGTTTSPRHKPKHPKLSSPTGTIKLPKSSAIAQLKQTTITDSFTAAVQPSEYLPQLNRAQREAVVAIPEGGLQILAGPGSGKTKVLTTRVAYLLQHYGLPAQDVV